MLATSTRGGLTTPFLVRPSDRSRAAFFASSGVKQRHLNLASWEIGMSPSLTALTASRGLSVTNGRERRRCRCGLDGMLGRLRSSEPRGIGSLVQTLRSAAAVVTRRLHTVSSSPAARILVATSLLCSGYLLVSHIIFGVSGPLALHEFLAEDVGALSMLVVLWLLIRPFANDDVLQTKAGAFDGAPPKGAFCANAGLTASPANGKAALRKAAQRRRLQIRRAIEHLRDVVRSLSDAAAAAMPACRQRPWTSRGLHNFHVAPRTDFLLPVEVAACHYPPGVSEHLQRLLEDQWLMLESGGAGQWLTPIPE